MQVDAAPFPEHVTGHQVGLHFFTLLKPNTATSAAGVGIKGQTQPSGEAF